MDPISIVINGINALSSPTEYTSGGVSATYQSAMQTLQTILNKTASTSGGPNPLTQQDTQDMANAIQTLTNLAKNGQLDTTMNPPMQYYITGNMSSGMSLVFQSLQAAGISVTGGAITLPQIQAWQNLAPLGVGAIMNNIAITSVSESQTLQSMVELDYVQQGNLYISNHLSSLEQQLQVTQNALNTLTNIQNISNEITVSPSGDFDFPPKNDGELTQGDINGLVGILAGSKVSSANAGLGATFSTTYQNELLAAGNAVRAGQFPSVSAYMSQQTTIANTLSTLLTTDNSSDRISLFSGIYKLLASAHFSQVFPTATPTSTAANELLGAKSALMAEILNMENLNLSSRSTENSLANFMYKVATDISAAFNGIAAGLPPDQLKTAQMSAVTAWIYDNQNQKISTTGGSTAGAIQERITGAIQAAQSLNDTEKQNVSDYSFMFQQFYTSASQVLTGVSKILVDMTQNFH